MLRSRRTKPTSWLLALVLALGLPALAGAEGEAKPAEKKPSISDSPYSGGPPPVTGGFTDTWQGGKKTSGAIPQGIISGGTASGGAEAPAGTKTPSE